MVEGFSGYEMTHLIGDLWRTDKSFLLTRLHIRVAASVSMSMLYRPISANVVPLLAPYVTVVEKI